MLIDKELKLLIVDDKMENLLELENTLKQLEITIIKATSGKDALELLKRNEVFLILMDVCMPDMDGFETAEHMRKYMRFKNIPIIFLTLRKTEQKYIFRGYELGAVDYLFKPVEPIVLVSKVKIFMNVYINNIHTLI